MCLKGGMLLFTSYQVTRLMENGKSGFYCCLSGTHLPRGTITIKFVLYILYFADGLDRDRERERQDAEHRERVDRERLAGEKQKLGHRRIDEQGEVSAFLTFMVGTFLCIIQKT